MKNIQTRTKYTKWLTDSTKVAMAHRDNLEDMARRTQEDDWKAYRQARNYCTKRQKNYRKYYLEKTYKKLEDENDSGKVFSLTKQLLGWSRSGPQPC